MVYHCVGRGDLARVVLINAELDARIGDLVGLPLDSHLVVEPSNDNRPGDDHW